MIETFDNLLEVLRKRYDEYNKEAKEVENGFYEADYKKAKVSEIKGKAEKLSEIEKDLNKLYGKINPEIRESSQVLQDLHSEILGFVSHYKTVDDIKLGVDTDGFVQITQTSSTYKNADGKDCKDCKYVTYGKLDDIPGLKSKYIAITKGQGIAMEGAEKDITEVEMRYNKHIYTPEGLEIQVTAAKKTESYPENIARVNTAERLRENTPQYSRFDGYSQPTNSSTEYDMLCCVTRGKGFGDGENNIGFCKIVEKKGKQSKTYIEPVLFGGERGAYLDLPHTDGRGYELEGSPEEIEAIENEAIEKWGGEEYWKIIAENAKEKNPKKDTIMNVDKERYPKALIKYAQKKCDEIEMRKRAQYVINGNNLAGVAQKQKASEVNSRTTSLKKEMQPTEPHRQQEDYQQ